MFELHYALDFINQINANCEKVLELKGELDSSFEKEKKNSEKESKKLALDLKRSLESYIENNISPFSKRFDDIIDSLAEDANCFIIENVEELELAYAITIHKSQGSEYLAVVVPILTGPKLLFNRNLLYTAITRAKDCVTIVGGREKVVEMAQNISEYQRYTSLKIAIRQVGGIYESAR